MGRGKKKRDAKRRKHLLSKNAIREKMGKPIFFTLTHCSKKLRGISNKYNYKANMHNLCFVGANFYNVKYQPPSLLIVIIEMQILQELISLTAI